jgi:hypothetical protein
MVNRNDIRIETYKKNKTIEDALSAANMAMSRMVDLCPVEGDTPKKPIVFIVGLQRSGSTLLAQLLCHTFAFTYPDNIVARFWEAPFLGVIVSRGLKDQFKDHQEIQYDSRYGVTSDLFGPHEFGYFWSKWFDFEPTHQLTEKRLSRVDVEGLGRNMFLMEHFGESPLLFKTIPLSMNVDFIARHFPTSLFVYVKRPLADVALSTYVGRLERYGNENIWWSLKPEQYVQLKKMRPVEQVAGQVFYSQKRVEACLMKVPKSRKVTIEYESMCEAPQRVVDRLEKFFGSGISRQDTEIPRSFQSRSKRRRNARLYKELKEALGHTHAQCD